MPEANKPRPAPRPVSHRLTRVARPLQKLVTGHVSRTVLLTVLLPLSVVSLFGSLTAAASCFPNGYDWGVRAISHLSSPVKNPQGFLLPALGIMAAMLLALPFAGYVARRLPPGTLRLARLSGLAFASGFVLMLLAMASQLAQPLIGLRWLHELLAGVGAACFILGLLCCCLCALEDRRRCSRGERSLPAPLALFWVSFALPPLCFLVALGALTLLGDHAGQTWAKEFRHSFRHTMLWHLAFWEWIGTVAAFAFLTGSVLLLPASAQTSVSMNMNTKRGRPGASAANPAFIWQQPVEL